MFDLLQTSKVNGETDSEKTLAESLVELTKPSQEFIFESYVDPKYKFAMKNIKMVSYLYILGDEYFTDLAEATKYLKDFAHDPDICNYVESDECNMAYMPHIHKVLTDSDDEAEIKYYWKTWREKNQQWGAKYLKNFVNLFKKAANLTNVEPLELWYKNYLDPNYLEDMEKVMQDLMPFYTKIHAYIRHYLNKKYGEDIVPRKGLIPHHLYYQVLIQNWNNENAIKPPYPDYTLPDFDLEVKNTVNRTEKTLLKIADEFFESLGFTFPDDDTFSDAVYDSDEENDKSGANDCKAQVYSQTPMYSISTDCPQINFRKFLQTHGWRTPSLFVLQKQELPFANFQSYNFEYPTGEAFILSASSPKHLHTLGIITEDELSSEQFIYNRLFKMVCSQCNIFYVLFACWFHSTCNLII